MFRPAFALALAACGSSTSLSIDADCNPLGAGSCLAPWPSSAFEVADDTTATGRRLAIPEGALPRGVTDTPIDPVRWNAVDGFSASTSITIAFPDGVSTVGLPAADNMDPSLAADSPTVLLDMTTGERVAHFAEVDETSFELQPLVLHPAARLVPGHRYAVAITARVVAHDGAELPVPDGFRALRDDRRTDHGLLEAMRPRFDDVLDALDQAGIADDGLVVAWDFTVASEASATADLHVARERALATLARYPSLYRLSDDRSDALGRSITGTIDGPLVLSNGGERRPGTRIERDDAGLPQVQGLHRIPFTAVIPACASRGPVPLALYGHTAFGGHDEVASDRIRALANELCIAIAGTDLRGMSRADLPALQRALDDLDRTDEIDVLVQGLLDQQTLVIALRTVFVDQIFRGAVDASRLYYLGDSVVLAQLPEVTRAVLLDPRLDRGAREASIDTAVAPIDAVLAHQLIEARWDRVLATKLPPLLLVSRAGDDAANLARTFGLPIVGSAPATPWGVKTIASPLAGSGWVPTREPDTIRTFLVTGRISR